MGYLFKPRFRNRHGEMQTSTIWRVRYSVNGIRQEESTDETLKTRAVEYMKRVEGKVADGKPVSAAASRIRFEELAQMLVDDYKANGRKSLRSLENRLRVHILPAFGRMKASQIKGADILRYRARRLAEGAAPATANRELATIRTAFRRAMKAEMIFYMPPIELLQERNARQGFFEKDQIDAVCSHLKEDVRDVVRFAWETGWRKAEILGLEWRSVKFQTGEITLDGRHTKNGKGRTFPMHADLRRLLEARRLRTDAIQRQTGQIISRVFHRKGKPIKEVRVAFGKACERVGLPDRIFHDLRRSAVRRFDRSGMGRHKAMMLSGHLTESTFKRYDIISPEDLRIARDHLDAFSARG